MDIAANEEIKAVPAQYAEMGCAFHHISCGRSPLYQGNFLAIRELRKLVMENHYDIVHCHTPIAGACARIACQPLRKKGMRVLYTAHGFHFFKGAPLKNWLIYYPIESILSRFTDGLVTINMEDYRRAKAKFHAKGTYYIHGVGLDTCKFYDCLIDRNEKRKELGVVDAEQFVLLSVGELQDRKNHQVVIEALHRLNDPGITYLIVGIGDNKTKYEEMVMAYGLHNNVKLLGFRKDIAELCKSADCFVHPSIREGLGIAPLEAMASGLPLISADINGIKDYAVDGITGCCVNPRDVNQMCSAIRKMKTDPDFRKYCGKNNIERAKQFDKTVSITEMEQIYSSVLNKQV